MKKRFKKTAITAAALLAAVIFAAGAGAAPQGSLQGKAGFESCDKGSAEYSYGKTSPEWKKTLTQEQSAEMSKLHLALEKELAPLDANINARRTEVKALIASENPDKAAMEKAVDEISALEKQVMRARYEYMMKVRGLLTPEQKLIFDKSMMKDKGLRRGHRK